MTQLNVSNIFARNQKPLNPTVHKALRLPLAAILDNACSVSTTM